MLCRRTSSAQREDQGSRRGNEPETRNGEGDRSERAR